jgi:predicted ATPase/class 3 adenylate cyclase
MRPAELPLGTVAFLMTDIEGSTRLAGELGAGFATLLDDHFRLLGESVASRGGTLVSSEGDSVFAVFPTTRQAILAAVEAQRAIATFAWPGSRQLRVRMGIHAGEAVFGGRDYTGLEVHRTARLMSAAHGGQILISAAARALAGDLGQDIAFRDLGDHQLRDLPAPDRLFGIVAPGLPASFPPPRTQPLGVPTNLPVELDTFVGRERELAAATTLLTTTHLLTLSGPGGTGKTRLATEIARRSLVAYPDGVWLVALDAIRDPSLVLPAIARVLGVPEGPSGAGIGETLAGRRVLAILDNFEQVIDAATEVAALVSSASTLTVLVTSREPLAVAGERVFGVPPLATLDERPNLQANDVANNDCVALFVERARAVRADFELTDANAGAIVAICRRVDGLPLAIELAAARVNLLGPDDILVRLHDRLALLASSRRDLPPRQRTLRGAVDWSYELLDQPQRAAFRRFAAFAGGADLPSFTAVVDPTSEFGDPLELAGALVDRSLLRSQPADHGPWLTMLDTLRDAASERLEADAAEEREVKRRHAAWYVDVAESANGVLRRPDRDAVLERIERELPNLRAAVAFAKSDGDMATAARIVVELRDFWHAHGHLAEGLALLGDLADGPGAGLTASDRLDVLLVAATLSAWNGHYASAERFASEGIAEARVLGDERRLAMAHSGHAWARLVPDPAGARNEFEEVIPMVRSMGDLATLQSALGGYHLALINLGEWGAAETVLDEATAVSTELGDRYTMAYNLISRGFLRARLGDLSGALHAHRESLVESRRAGSVAGIALAIDAIAVDLAAIGNPANAATLGSGAARMRDEAGGGPSTAMAGLPDPLVLAQQALDADAYASAAAEGRAISTEALVDLALSWSAEGQVR